jgi:hypothetical protein
VGKAGAGPVAQGTSLLDTKQETSLTQGLEVEAKIGGGDLEDSASLSGHQSLWFMANQQFEHIEANRGGEGLEDKDRLLPGDGVIVCRSEKGGQSANGMRILTVVEVFRSGAS